MSTDLLTLHLTSVNNRISDCITTKKDKNVMQNNSKDLNNEHKKSLNNPVNRKRSRGTSYIGNTGIMNLLNL